MKSDILVSHARSVASLAQYLPDSASGKLAVAEVFRLIDQAGGIFFPCRMWLGSSDQTFTPFSHGSGKSPLNDRKLILDVFFRGQIKIGGVGRLTGHGKINHIFILGKKS